MANKVEAIEKELTQRQNNLAELQIELDMAVEAGDTKGVQHYQAEIAAAKLFIESSQRRLVKAHEQQVIDNKKREFENLMLHASAGIDASKSRGKVYAKLIKDIRALAGQVADIEKLNRDCYTNVFIPIKAGRAKGVAYPNEVAIQLASGGNLFKFISAALKEAGLLKLIGLDEIDTKTSVASVEQACVDATERIESNVKEYLRRAAVNIGLEKGENFNAELDAARAERVKRMEEAANSVEVPNG